MYAPYRHCNRRYGAFFVPLRTNIFALPYTKLHDPPFIEM